MKPTHRRAFGSLRSGCLLSFALAAVATAPAAHAASRPRIAIAAVRPDGPAQPSSAPIAPGAVLSVEPARAADATVLAFSNGVRFDTRDGEPASVRGRELETNATGPGYFLVQFDGSIRDAWRRGVEAAGARVIAYQPNNALLVRLDAEALARVSAAEGVRWIGAYRAAYKTSAAWGTRLASPELVEAKVLVFAPESLGEATQTMVALGATIVQTSDNGVNKIARIRVAGSALAQVAEVPAVQWIEPYAMPTIHNSVAQWITQTHVSENRAIWDHGIHGESQILSTSDTGVRSSHNMFKDPAVTITSSFTDYPTHRKIVGYRVMPGATFGDDGNVSQQTYHGSHTAGTACGDDSYVGGASTLDGMALKARLYFCDVGSLEFISGSWQQSLTGVPLDLNDLFIYPYTGNTAGGARLMSNSWGFDDVLNYGGVYELNAMQADQFMWEHKDFLIFFSNGNHGPTVGTVLPPATAKNIVSVGGTDDTNGNTIGSLSSRGNTLDGRVKPTVSAPGFSVNSAWGKDDVSYHFLGGTSMACPGAMGNAALVRQYLTEGWYPTGAKVAADAIASPSAALLKSVLVNSCDPGPAFPGTDFGWGRVDLDSALYFAGDTRDLAVIDNAKGLVTGDQIEYHVTVSGSTIPLKITLVWTDYPGAPSAATELVNDVNLTVISPASVTYLGNALSGGQSIANAVTADTRNVEEWVRVNAPVAGQWTIRVTGQNVALGPQPFALAVSGDLARTTGLLTLDKPAYGPTETIFVRLEDTTPGLTSPSVKFASASGDTESIVLAGSSGVFTGSVPLLFGVLHSSDGSLSAANGDLLTATYADASAGPATLTATAVVDATAFTISNVAATAVVQIAATVSWLTSSAGSSQVFYGTTPALGSSTPYSADQVTTHSVQLSNLAPNTTYYFEVESTDARGNTVRDTNGGRHYTFTTSTRPDVFLVLGDQSFPSDHLQRYLNAFARKGWLLDYTYCDLNGNPALGNKSSGLRSYPVVWWNSGLEQYPQFTDPQIDLFTQLHEGGARIAVSSHDVMWDFGSVSSPDWSVERQAFTNNFLHASFKVDPTDITYIGGVPGDPISGAYVAGVSYTQSRSGAAGDEVAIVNGSGTGVYDWVDDATPDNVGVRWTSSGPLGNPGTAAWGGQATQVAAMFWEASELNAAIADDLTRADIIDKTIQWLTGRNHPTVTVSAPVAGGTISGATTPITWTATPAGGFTIGSTTLEYSEDRGQTWTVIASGNLTSPYTWDLSSVLNSSHARVRVRVEDSGSPSLTGFVATGDFTLARPGGDFAGPVIIAGSTTFAANPVNRTGTVSVQAAASDTSSGGSLLHAAEYSVGASPAPAGTGTAMTGAFDVSANATISGSASAGPLTCTSCTMWLRAQDNAGNWGPATGTAFVVRPDPTDARDVEDPDATGAFAFSLGPSRPNPFGSFTELRYSLPRAGDVSLRVYDANGALVRALVSGQAGEGVHVTRWSGDTERGTRAPAGVYFVKLAADGRVATRRIVMLD